MSKTKIVKFPERWLHICTTINTQHRFYPQRQEEKARKEARKIVNGLIKDLNKIIENPERVPDVIEDAKGDLAEMVLLRVEKLQDMLGVEKQ